MLVVSLFQKAVDTFILSPRFLFLHRLCSKLSVCSVSLTRSGVLFWGRSLARPVTNTWEAPLTIAPQRQSNGASIFSSIWREDPGTSSKWSFSQHHQNHHDVCGGRQNSSVTRSWLIWFWSITSHTNGMRTFSWYFASLAPWWLCLVKMPSPENCRINIADRHIDVADSAGGFFFSPFIYGVWSVGSTR